MNERDMDKNPYSVDEARIAAFFCERGVGGGPDPVGSILAGYAYVVAERNALRAAPARCDAECEEALRRLTTKLQEIHVHPRFRSVWEIAQLHLGPYDGPTYAEELDAAEAVLSALSPDPGTVAVASAEGKAHG